MSAKVLNGAAYDHELSVDDEGHREHTLHWRVETGIGDGPLAALYATGMPVPGSALAADLWAFYKRRGTARLISEANSKRRWECTTVFSTKPIERGQSSSVENPLSEPPKISGGFNRTMKEVRIDKDGKAILNACKEQVTGIQGPEDHQTLKISMNVATINLTYMGDYVGAVNDSTFWGCAARTILCMPFTWEKVYYDGNSHYYFHCQFEFEYKSDTWDEQIVNWGNMVVIPGTTPPKFRRSIDPFENTIKVLLKADGTATTTPELISPKPRVKREKNFALAGWPATVP